METKFSANIGNKELEIITGKIAKQASGSVLVKYGETTLLITAVAAKDPKLDMSFLPLSVEYQEKIYAAGRIPGNYFRREIGRPSEKETLTARLIDRPIRPLFPEGYNFETQIIATVLSSDNQCDPGVLAITGASAALQISDIPFEGPIAGVHVGRINGEFIANPTPEQCEKSDIDLTVACSKTGVVMVEGSSQIVSEQDMLDAIFFGHAASQPLIEIQEKLAGSIGKEKRQLILTEKNQELVKEVIEFSTSGIHERVQIKTKEERQNALRELKEETINRFEEKYPEEIKEIKEVFSKTVKNVCRSIVLEENRRIDGRNFDEIRQIDCETGLLPRPHGSALFTRGETQVLGVLTLGSGMDEQRVETLAGNETRSFMLHYNFPPYSVGEVKRPGGPSRRDIGHGNLATRAIVPIIPERENFEYTIRLVGEVMESNGSSSMGTVCSGCLALMDGGVPIKAPVSGIAMGLVSGENGKTVILSDILGDEDHFGDMDFKVAGTRDGITALQMDIKIKELSREIMEKALSQAKAGRHHILDKMLNTIDKSRKEISKYAPKIISIQIKSDKIRDIIGPGGKVIRALQADTNTVIEVDDSGIVKIAAQNQEDGDLALKMVSDIAMDPEIGAIYEGTVVKITDFGAFVNIKPGTDGLVHISELADYRVKQVTDIIKEGDVISVKVLDITRDGKIKLSYKAAQENDKK